MRFPSTVGLSCVLLATPLPGDAASASIPYCPAPFSRLVDSRIFRGYAVPVTAGRSRHVRPDVGSGRARLYRTAIREGAEGGPNFADHYTLVPIGCGAATLCPAIMDAATGRVYFPPELRSVEGLIVDTGGATVHILNFRRDSRLLQVIGSPNEQRHRAGISYYIWRSGRLRLIRHTSAADLCGLPVSTQF